MLIARKDAVVRVPVVLIDSGGLPVDGITPAELNDTVGAGNVSVVKADGTITSLALTNGVSWVEIDDARAPGLYHIVVPASLTDVVGCLQVVVQPNASEFEASILSLSVEELYQAVQINRNNYKIETTGPDAYRLIIYDDDGVTVLHKFDLTDAEGNPTINNPFERTRV